MERVAKAVNLASDFGIRISRCGYGYGNCILMVLRENTYFIVLIISCYFIPYAPLTGSKKIGILGVKKVKTINKMPMKHIERKASNGFLHLKFPFLSKTASSKKEIAAEIKNIAILSQSGVLPKTPFKV